MADTNAKTGTIQVTVPDMTCGHCVAAVTRAIADAVPGASVRVDLATHSVAVDGAERRAVEAAIAEAGYTPSPPGA